jgi:hypothetical protein
MTMKSHHKKIKKSHHKKIKKSHHKKIKKSHHKKIKKSHHKKIKKSHRRVRYVKYMEGGSGETSTVRTRNLLADISVEDLIIWGMWFEQEDDGNTEVAGDGLDDDDPTDPDDEEEEEGEEEVMPENDQYEAMITSIASIASISGISYDKIKKHVRNHIKETPGEPLSIDDIISKPA